MEVTVEEAFQLYDTTESGKISATDLVEALRCLGKRLTEDDAKAMVNKAEVDFGGSVCTARVMWCDVYGCKHSCKRVHP